MAALTEKGHSEEFILSEGNGTISRSTGTVITGATYEVGQVVSRITASGKLAIVDLAASTGAETAVGILLGDRLGTLAADRANVPFLARDCEVADSLIVYPAGATSGNKITIRASLALVGIIVRI